MYFLTLGSLLSISFKIRQKYPNIYSFVYSPALNPDCAIVMHLRNKVRALIFFFYFAKNTIFCKKDSLSHGIIKVYPAIICFSATLIY